ncbi:MAG: hypothetical protein ABUS79_13180 [Pseudomonadota bacterium]
MQRSIRICTGALMICGALAASTARAKEADGLGDTPSPNPSQTTAPESPPPGPSVNAPRVPPEPPDPEAEVLPPRRILDGGAWTAPAPPPAPSWFYVPPLEFGLGTGNRRWGLQFYGFVELDIVHDSTRGFNESLGNGIIPRRELLSPGAQMLPQLTPDGGLAPNPAGVNGRTTESARNSRFGMKVTAPSVHQVKSSILIEVDFFGNQPPNGTYSYTQLPAPLTENNLLASGALHMRHAYFKLESPYINMLAGQTYDLFGFQNYFFPATSELFPMPNQAFSRNPQLRLYETFDSGALGLDVAVAAVRPPQRDAEIPSIEAGVMFRLNSWKGLHTPGSLGTAADPLAIGVSGTLRHFKIDYTSAVPVQYDQENGWAISVDAFVPIIPARNSYDRSNKLTLTASYTTGTAYQDLMGGMTMGLGAVRYPPAPGTTEVLPPPPEQGVAGVALPQTSFPPANIDPGLILFDYSGGGFAHTINLRTWMVGLQYYLPGGRIWIAGNYSHADSNNIVDALGGAAITQANGLVIANPYAKSVITESNYYDANLFVDVTASVRIGVSGSLLRQKYADRSPPDMMTTQTPNTSVDVPADWPAAEVVRNVRFRLNFYDYF